MAGKNFAQRLEAEKKEYFRCGKVTGEQRCADVFALAMLECGITRPKIREIYEAARQIGEETVDAFDTKNPECDVIQEKMERKLKSIFPDEFAPWNERYEYMKQARY